MPSFELYKGSVKKYPFEHDCAFGKNTVRDIDYDATIIITVNVNILKSVIRKKNTSKDK